MTSTVIAGLACVVADWLTCPYFTIEGVLCKQRGNIDPVGLLADHHLAFK